MTQILFNSQDRQKQPIPGNFFNSDEDIEMDRPINFVHHRHRLHAGQGQEIDLLAAIGQLDGLLHYLDLQTLPDLEGV